MPNSFLDRLLRRGKSSEPPALNTAPSITITEVSCQVRRSICIDEAWTAIEAGITASVPPGMEAKEAQRQVFNLAAVEVNERMRLIRGVPATTPARTQ